MEKPTIGQRVDSFCKFVWNSKKKEFLARSGRSWTEIGFFYLIFYACLTGFFAATVAAFYQTIDERSPKLQGKDSLLKGNPGMGFEPMPDLETTLVYVSAATRMPYQDSFNKVLQDYKMANLDNTDCSGINSTRPDASVACRVDFENLTSSCNKGNEYGFFDGQPCVLLKLNRIYGWVPEVWDVDEAQSASAIPDSIKRIYSPDRIWVDCHGENPADNDNLGQDYIEYSPMQGFPLSFYPYLRQKDYRSPVVFVKFNNVSRHMGLMIECKALAKNIVVDRSEREGCVHFELLVDMKLGEITFWGGPPPKNFESHNVVPWIPKRVTDLPRNVPP